MLKEFYTILSSGKRFPGVSVRSHDGSFKSHGFAEQCQAMLFSVLPKRRFLCLALGFRPNVAAWEYIF